MDGLNVPLDEVALDDGEDTILVDALVRGGSEPLPAAVVSGIAGTAPG
jgi:hypothetical protein